MRTKLRNRISLLFLAFVLLLSMPAVALAQDAGDSTGSGSSPAPTIQSDKDDYAPGELVTLTGSNWQPGESVWIVVDDDGVAEERWQRDVEVTADENGDLRDQFNLPDWFVADYTVTATGALSGMATTTFTDAAAFGGCVPSPNIPNQPGTITVDTETDEWNTTANATCSLREAIRTANQDTAADTIVLPAGTYTVNRTVSGSGSGEDNTERGDLDVKNSVTITGAGVRTTIIQAGTTNTNGIDRVLHFQSAGTSTLSGVTVKHGKINDDGGGIKTDRPLTLTDVAITENQTTTSGKNGGGISHQGGQLTINRATISGNTTAGQGGGLHTTSGDANLTNVTITNNSAANGGGIRVNSDTKTLVNVTVSHNESSAAGSNIDRDSGTIRLTNTIVSDGTSGANCRGSGSNLVNVANNLDSGTSCGFGTANGSKSNATANLGALQNNDGPTDTRALGIGSAAIDAGTASSAPSVDQRSVSRPQGSAYDIGAFELEAAQQENTAISNVSGSGTYGGNATLTAKLTTGGNDLSGKTIEFELRGNPVCDNDTNTALQACPTTGTNGVATLSNVSLSGIDAGGPTGTGYQNAVSASFAGDANYNGSGPTTGNLTVDKAEAELTFGLSTLPGKSYGDAAFSVTSYASSNSPAAITFALGSGSRGCTVTSAGQVTITGAATGTDKCIIEASQAANANYSAAGPVSQSFNITKAALTVTADNKNMTYADPVPALTYQITGFVNSEGLTTSGVSGNPILSTTATSSSGAGNYPITVGLGTLASSNYSFNLVNGALTVAKRSANVVYNGDNYAAVASGNATINLSAKVSRPSGSLGNLALANVQFTVKNYGGGVVTTKNAMADASGDAVTTASIPTSDNPYTVEVRIAPANAYWTSGTDISSLQVILGSGSGRTAGGGWIADAANTINGKSNFGFTVQNSKTGIKGNSLFIYRVLEGSNRVQYVVKSNSWVGGGLTFNVNSDSAKATFTGKATVQRYVNGVLDTTFAGGNHTFTVDVLDGDLKTPKEKDAYAITLRNSSNVIVKQLGSRTIPTPLGGGNVLVQRK